MSLFAYYIDSLEIKIETNNLPIKSGPKQTNLEWFVCVQIDYFFWKYVWSYKGIKFALFCIINWISILSLQISCFLRDSL